MRNKKMFAVIVLSSMFASQCFAHGIIDPIAGGFENVSVGDQGLSILTWLQLMISVVL